MKVIKKISNYIDSLNDYDMADKPWYAKFLGYIVAFFIATSLIWILFVFFLLDNYAEKNNIFLLKEILWLLVKIGIIIFFFYLGKIIVEQNKKRWKVYGIIFCIALILSILSFSNNDGEICNYDEYDPIYGGSGYENCETVEKRNSDEQALYSIKIFLLLSSAMSLGAFEKKQNENS